MGGKDRGRKLKGPSGTEFRPSTGRVKEFIFSYLFDVTGTVFLDLFSGTGSIGIDALSRGAVSGVFVEQSYRHLSLLRHNLAACGYTDNTRIIQGDVFTAIRTLAEQAQQFDLIFADPPFKAMYRSEIVESIARSGILKEDGFLIVEHEQHDEDNRSHPFAMIRQKKFGHCVISIYRVSS